MAVLDGPHLSAILDGDPLIRRRVPFVLGVRELEGLVDDDVVRRSTLDVAAAHELARVFVTTRAYRSTVDVLERHAFAVVSGPPEMGKTAIARTVALARLTEGWEAHECVRPEQLWERYDADRPQVFIADDAFGSTEYRPDAAERWALDLPRVLGALDERHWLLWTSRPAPLRAGLARVHREHGVERFPQPAEVHVDAADLDVGERAAMLFRHARASQVPLAQVAIIRSSASTIVGHPHLTPERIRRFVTQRLPQIDGGARRVLPVGLRRLVAAEIREPTAAMRASFAALPEAHRALLLALLDQPPGPVAERELAVAARRHLEGGLPRPPGELVDALTDHFLRVVPPQSVTWVHPSWRDVAIEALADDAGERQRFLHACEVDGLALALSVGRRRGGRALAPAAARRTPTGTRSPTACTTSCATAATRTSCACSTCWRRRSRRPLGRAGGGRGRRAGGARPGHGGPPARRAGAARADRPAGGLAGARHRGRPGRGASRRRCGLDRARADAGQRPRRPRGAHAASRRGRGSRARCASTPTRRSSASAATSRWLTWQLTDRLPPSTAFGKGLQAATGVPPSRPAAAATSRVEVTDLAPPDADLVQRVLRDLGPRWDGGDASGARPERPRPSPPATPPAAGPGGRGSAERAPSRRGPASRHRVRRRPPGSPPAR